MQSENGVLSEAGNSQKYEHTYTVDSGYFTILYKGGAVNVTSVFLHILK